MILNMPIKIWPRTFISLFVRNWAIYLKKKSKEELYQRFSAFACLPSWASFITECHRKAITTQKSMRLKKISAFIVRKNCKITLIQLETKNSNSRVKK